MYYELSILNSPLKNLTYKSAKELKPFEVVKVLLNGKEKNAIVIKKCEKPDFECLEIVEKVGYYPLFMRKLAKFISEYYVCTLGEACGLMQFCTDKQSEKKEEFISCEELNLSSKQQNAKKELQKHPQVLLFGDTGSGKTEVYISLMKEVLQSGKNIIFLMPEISLTPQMQKRLMRHFGSLLALWHSKVTKSKKQKILSGLQTGEVRIVAGARSSLFLPLSDVGLIIVDEEHDDSYKSTNGVRYNARDLALFYGKTLGARVVLGSATPSATSYKKLPHVRLKGTFFESQKHFIYEEAQNEITPFLLSHVKKVVEKDKQVIVFVPTRANFKYLTCRDCGTSIECPFCSVGMSLHHDKNLLKCHYCNCVLPIPKTCPNCGGEMLEAKRIGTVEVAKILKENFPQKNIQIFDRDTITTQKKLKELLKNFNDKNIDILVGTQMLSKGHDYHDVALSVILGLDGLLSQPDFKSREKTLSLAIQIAGRSGRKGEGKVLMQTKQRSFFEPFMENYDEFLEDELYFRDGLYPPFKRLLRILIATSCEEKAQEITNELVKRIENTNLQVDIIGSGKSNIQKIYKKFRYEIMLRSDSPKELIKVAHLCKMPNVQIDMDPLSFS